MTTTVLSTTGHEVSPTFRASPFQFGVTGPAQNVSVVVTESMTIVAGWADAAQVSSATTTFSVAGDGIVLFENFEGSGVVPGLNVSELEEGWSD